MNMNPTMIKQLIKSNPIYLIFAGLFIASFGSLMQQRSITVFVTYPMYGLAMAVIWVGCYLFIIKVKKAKEIKING
jgi:hypothetical protein